jgi:hypothetical protein
MFSSVLDQRSALPVWNERYTLQIFLFVVNSWKLETQKKGRFIYNEKKHTTPRLHLIYVLYNDTENKGWKEKLSPPFWETKSFSDCWERDSVPMRVQISCWKIWSQKQMILNCMFWMQLWSDVNQYWQDEALFVG